MIRRMLRLGIRLGLLAGVGLALFKLVQGRRASDYGSPSPDWAPPPAPAANPNLPKPAAEPELVKPVVLEEIVEKKKAAGPTAPPSPAADPLPPVGTGGSVVKKAAPAKKLPAVAPAGDANGAGPVKKAARKPAPRPADTADAGAPPKKAAPAKKSAAKKVAPAVQNARDLAAAKKAAPAKKAPKKAQP